MGAGAAPPAPEDRARPHLTQLMQFLDRIPPDDLSYNTFKTNVFPVYLLAKIKELGKNDKL